MIKSVSETIKNKSKEEKGEFLHILMGALAAIRKCVRRSVEMSSKKW